MIVNQIWQSSDVSADFTGRVSALISIFGEISLESLMEFYQRLFCYDLVVRNFLVLFRDLQGSTETESNAGG